MGTDIHWVLEQKFNDKWVGIYASDAAPVPYGEIHIKDISQAKSLASPRTYSSKLHYFFPTLAMRNYSVFAKLASVRGEGNDPKGMPEDASELSTALTQDWGMDAHSHTYETAKDFITAWLDEYELAEEFKQRLLHGSGAFQHAYYLGLDPHYIDNYRVVMWFDN